VASERKIAIKKAKEPFLKYNSRITINDGG
jgi:hypothetical protein